MKKYCACYFALVLFIARRKTFPFESQRKDSISLAKSLPELARYAINVYKEENKQTYKDNLFRLHIVAKHYAAVTPVLRQLAQEMVGDSTKHRALGISFRLYANVMLQHPSSATETERLFEVQFQKLYTTLDEEGKGMVDQYYEKDH